MKHVFLKGLTLIFFLCLITGFVLYKGHYFDTKITTNQFVSSTDTSKIDSSLITPKENDRYKNKLMSSSKFIRAFELDEMLSDSIQPPLIFELSDSLKEN